MSGENAPVTGPGRMGHAGACAPGTCFVKDVLFCVEGHGEVAGVGDLDDVRPDVTKHNVAEVQDVFWQLDPENSQGDVLVTGHFQARKATFHKGRESVCSLLCAALLID